MKREYVARTEQTPSDRVAPSDRAGDGAGFWASLFSVRSAVLLIVVGLIVGAVYYFGRDDAPVDETEESFEVEPTGSAVASSERVVDLAGRESLLDPADVLRLSPTIPDTAELFSDEAVAGCERLVEAFPDRAKSHALLAVTLGKLGRKRDAKACWEEVLQRDDRFVEAWLSIGTILAELGDYERAEEYLRKTIELEATIASAYHELTSVLLQLNEADEALKFALEGERRFPENCQSQYWLGLVHSHRKEYQDACEHLKKAVEIDPVWSFSYFPLAMACTQLGQTEQAAEYRRKTAEIKANSSRMDRAQVRQYDDDERHRHIARQTHLLAATFALQFKIPELAEAYILRAVAVSPDDPVSMDALEYFYENEGRVEDGVRALEELASSRPEEPNILLQQGRWLVGLSAWSQAKERLMKVLALDSQCAEAHFLLGQVYLRSNADLAAAELHVRKAVVLEPTPTSLRLLANVCSVRGDNFEAARIMERLRALESLPR